MDWTKPHAGVSHLKHRNGWTATVTDYSSFSELMIWRPGIPMSQFDLSTHVSAAAAREYAEEHLNILCPVKD